MLQLSKEIKKAGQAYGELSVLGYRNELFLNTDLEKYSQVYVATEDGSAGTERNGTGCHKGKGIIRRCDLCLWTDADAACDQGVCCG